MIIASCHYQVKRLRLKFSVNVSHSISLHHFVSSSISSMAASQLRDFFVRSICQITGLEPSYITDEFQFKVGTTPLSPIGYPFVAVIAFCIGIPWLQHFMRHRESPPLKYLIVIHNLFLCISSLLLALFLMSTLYAMHESNPDEYGAFRIYCHLTVSDQRGTLTFIYYVNHLVKYYELIDTVFLALKHKPLTFLHCYHHPATLVLTWGQLVDSTGIQWLVILLNLYVHTIMYFYYAMATLRIRIPWKRIVTIGQITQFVIDIIACYSGWALHDLKGHCYASHRGGMMGIFILTSYLYLFVDFYGETYRKKKLKQKQN